jgi:hypothetical protein
LVQRFDRFCCRVGVRLWSQLNGYFGSSGKQLTVIDSNAAIDGPELGSGSVESRDERLLLTLLAVELSL